MKQESVGLIGKKGLKKFVLEPTANNQQTESSTNSNDHRRPVSTTVNEKPILFTPENFVFDQEKNKALMENLPKSLEEFLLENAKSIPTTVDCVTTTEAETVNTQLQEKFQPDGFRFQASLMDSLRAYINACIYVDMTERAFSVLNEYRRKKLNGTKFKFNNPELFVELMAKYASGKNWQRVNEIYSILLEEKVSITPQVYMLMLSCLGRSPGNKKLNASIEKCIEMAAQRVF